MLNLLVWNTVHKEGYFGDNFCDLKRKTRLRNDAGCRNNDGATFLLGVLRTPER